MTSLPARLRLLEARDIPDALRLKEAAGWNQTEEDWRLFLHLAPEGCFALEKEGTVIATSTAIPYGPFGWVGMMLVDPGERRQGHGSRTLAAAVSFLETRGVLAGLDATPLGKPLYDRHGFKDLYLVERWIGTAPAGPPATPAAPAGPAGPRALPDSRRLPGCRRLEKTLPEDLLAFDRQCFGADRSGLLLALLERPSALGFVLRREGRVEGYLLGRPGSRFYHLGPWVARDPPVAAALLEEALAPLAGVQVGVDVPVPNQPARDLAGRAGLEAARTLTRMARPAPAPDAAGGSVFAPRGGAPPEGSVPPGGLPDQIFGLAGLEWG